MKLGKLIGLIALTAALMSFVVVGVASATTLTGSGGTTLGAGTEFEMESEGTITLHPPIGSLTCEKVWWKSDQLNAGNSTVVELLLTKKTWDFCNFTFHTKKVGVLRLHQNLGAGNATVASTGSEWTVVYLGFHCIFSTNNTQLGTLTASSVTGSNATLDISATIPRTGGSSGAFCGSTAAMTGSFKVTKPNPLNID